MRVELTAKQWKTVGRVILIGLPILILLIVGCGPSLFPLLGRVFKALFPSIWVALGYVYVAVLFFVLGQKKAEKEAASEEE